VAAPFDDLGSRTCLLGRAACGWKNPCSVHPHWEEVSNGLQSFFRDTTIADLLGGIADRPSMAPVNDVTVKPPSTARAGRPKRPARRRAS
jgi:DNA-binding IscR family transcriptional regulator